MINFLSEKNKKEVRSEYSSRVTSSFLIIFSLIMLVVIVFLTPAYTLSIYRKGVISDQLTMVKNSSSNQNNTSLEEVKKVNEIVSVLSSEGDMKKSISDYVKSILSVKGSGIKISSISFDYDAAKNARINLKGFSNTRDALTKFVKEIKNLNLFSSVDLPISNLVKSTDADFTISLILNKE